MSKKFIIIPDSYKGTLAATEVCEIIADAIRAKHDGHGSAPTGDAKGDGHGFVCAGDAKGDERGPRAEIITIPMADGGEGTCECFAHALGGELVAVTAIDAYGDFKEARYWRDGERAVIEMAAIAGYDTDGPQRPDIATTYGVGQLIKHAIESGCTDITIGLGGSATNDGGAGMVAAMGVHFMNDIGAEFLPTGSSLAQIAAADTTELDALIQGVHIQAMCDVTNPLCGAKGAAHIFAPQKGADEQMVEMLDENLREYARFIDGLAGRGGASGGARDLGGASDGSDASGGERTSIANIPGAGAAGGMGAGAIAFLGAGLRPGAEIVLDMVGFDYLCADCDMIITGEGSLDAQSLSGKVVSRVAARAKAYGVPVTVIAGRVALTEDQIRAAGIDRAIATIDFCENPDEYQKTAREDLRRAAELI